MASPFQAFDFIEADALIDERLQARTAGAVGGKGGA